MAADNLHFFFVPGELLAQSEDKAVSMAGGAEFRSLLACFLDS